LFVVDGVPIDNSGGGSELQRGASPSNRAVDINPEDIESVVVLKMLLQQFFMDLEVHLVLF
jgi:outer membrane receptor protein involved in Fe transport